MLNKCAVFCTKRLEKYLTISEDEKEIYVYGFELSISTLFSLSLILVLSLILGHIYYSFFFMLFFFTMRLFCGGYHANTYAKCFIITNLIFLSTVVLTQIIIDLQLIKIMPFLFALSTLTIFIFAPVKNKNHPCSEKTVNKNRKISRFLSCFYYLIYICIFLFSKSQHLIVNAAWSFIWVSIMIIIEKIKQRREAK